MTRAHPLLTTAIPPLLLFCLYCFLLSYQSFGALNLTCGVCRPRRNSYYAKYRHHEQNMYFPVLKKLNPNVALFILDIIRSLPTDNPYNALNDCLLQAYTLSDYQHAIQLQDFPLLGDR